MSGADDPPREPAVERDVMPIVERSPAGLPTGVIVLGAVVAAALLFGVLESRRERLSAPATTAPQATAPESPPPPLAVPEAEPSAAPAPPAPPPAYAPLAQAPAPPPRAPRAEPPAYAPPPAFSVAIAPPAASPAPPPPSRASTGGVVVFDRGAEGAPASGGKGAEAAADTPAVRARAGMFANRATTVAQGTLIPAILETGFDSSRPGAARALVQRDIRGFDGSRILIPRGSRLIGEYQSDAAAGQNRALILWTRLIRPDGGTIALGSPVTDTQGRTGAKAHVNTHFLARFSNAFLLTSLNIGTALAARGSNSPVVVALPGSLQTTTSTASPSLDIKPTLTVAPGTSISVLAARDLDFTDLDGRP